MSNKRSRSCFGDDDTVRIKVAPPADGPADAAGAQQQQEQPAPLEAPRSLLAAVSTCFAALPPDAAEWDVSGLVIEGACASREVVVSWLHAVYRCVEGRGRGHTHTHACSPLAWRWACGGCAPRQAARQLMVLCGQYMMMRGQAGSS